MRYLHTMVRVSDLEKSLHFYCDILGLIKVKHDDYPNGQFSLIYLAAPLDESQAKQNSAPLLELTHNWEPENYSTGRNFGHLAFEVANIYETCERLEQAGVVINRPPRDGYMAFIKSPDNISIELLQKGEALPLSKKWMDAENIGDW